MSRVGKNPVSITGGAKVSINGNTVQVQGKLGTLSIDVQPLIQVALEGEQVVVSRVNETRNARALHGLTRALIANMVQGVTQGYEKKLVINGVGFTGQVKGQEVHLKVGYADTRIVPIPTGITVNIKGQDVTVTGCDKQLVGQTAAAIREHRKPEPYNAKGIAYAGERILRKAGKAMSK